MLAALARLRWLAVVGQIAATAVAAAVLKLELPLAAIFALIVFTAISNALLDVGNRIMRMPAWIVQGVLLLDVLLLTSLLYLTGGPKNPFATLYLVHVAMAVLVLGTLWTWLVVATVSACYGLILCWHRDLTPELPASVFATGNWLALVLVSVLVATFIGRVTRALRQRDYELAAVRDRAVKNEQLAALTTLSAGAAHELNTPLGTIALVARELELACDRTGDQSMQEDARLIRREVDRCRHILSRMKLDLGEDVLQRASVDLTELVARLRENFDGAVYRDRLRISQAPDARSAQAPIRALEQSLLVLLRNAFDASSADGLVKLDITRENGSMRFSVRDVGIGMSPEMLRRAGEPFFTTKQPGEGMGLGLFLVRLVAEQLGARFSIDSKLGEGTCCILELPMNAMARE